MRNFAGPLTLRRLPRPFIVGLALTFVVLQQNGDVLAQVAAAGDSEHFTYDRGVSLNVKRVAVRVQDGITIEDITYTGSDGDTVPAYLVIPKGIGKFAGVIWGHWLMPNAANSNRKESPDPALVAQQVVDLRRGLDLLLLRPDIDASRIAYVGHSWDAGIGAILDATDKRFAAFVFMSGPQSMTKRILASPDMAALRKSNDKAQLKEVEDSLKADAWADPGTYTSELGPAPALFQYGLNDEKWVPLASAKDYAAEASGPKTIEFYDADHALNAKARTDRDSFLTKTLRLPH